jgi:hypothetical protein
MDFALTTWRDRERRTDARLSGGMCAWLVAARLRPGIDVDVLDLSAGGALVEGSFRLLPGVSVDLQLIATTACRLVRGRVSRCQVSAVDPFTGMRYRAAVVFDEPVEFPHDDLVTPGYWLPRTLALPGSRMGTDYPADRRPPCETKESRGK